MDARGNQAQACCSAYEAAFLGGTASPEELGRFLVLFSTFAILGELGTRSTESRRAPLTASFHEVFVPKWLGAARVSGACCCLVCHPWERFGRLLPLGEYKRHDEYR